MDGNGREPVGKWNKLKKGGSGSRAEKGDEELFGVVGGQYKNKREEENREITMREVGNKRK